jgi:pyridoxal phosphate enzyme (YggS family)
MSTIPSNLQAVRQRVRTAAQSAARDPDAIAVLAVSKTFDAGAVIEAALAGQRAFGENYLQEALQKMDQVARLRPDLPIEWHFIGPVQSNKTRAIAERFDWVHSVDRLKIAQRLSEQRPDALPPLNLCLQVNISGEASKSGVMPDATHALASAIAALPRLRLRGLMAIPEAASDPAAQHLSLRRMQDLFERLKTDGLPLDTLSMGMSADLDAAVAEGATIVRIGTAIFGKRDYAK